VPGHLAVMSRADCPGARGLTAGAHADLPVRSRPPVSAILAGGQGSGSISTSGFMARIGPARALTTGQPRSAAR
jgi:hypothetical protein